MIVVAHHPGKHQTTRSAAINDGNWSRTVSLICSEVILWTLWTNFLSLFRSLHRQLVPKKGVSAHTSLLRGYYRHCARLHLVLFDTQRMYKTRVHGSEAIAYAPPSPPPPPPPARMSRSDPVAAAQDGRPACEAASASFPVVPLPSALAVDANEFKQIHSIGISMYTFRHNQKLQNVGPGSYNTEKGLELVSPRSPRWSTATTSPRMSLVKKSSEEQDADERASVRKNLLSLRTLFLPEFERRTVVDGSDDGVAPRWLRPTRSASSRRALVAAATASQTQHAAAAPAPMRYAATPHTRRGEDAQNRLPSDAASGAVVDGAAATATMRSPRPPSGNKALLRKVVPPTMEEREASIRSTLTRPSSASVRYQQRAQHWVNGMQRDTAVAGVVLGNPRNGKTDALYDIDRGVAATVCASPRVSLGTCPRFPGDAPVPRPRPTSAAVHPPPPQLTTAQPPR